jgi:hypothetical protein
MSPTRKTSIPCAHAIAPGIAMAAVNAADVPMNSRLLSPFDIVVLHVFVTAFDYRL